MGWEMKRRGFLAFLITAPVSRALPWTKIAEFAPAPIAAEINITLQEIIATTLRARMPELIANIHANNALLKRLSRK